MSSAVLTFRQARETFAEQNRLLTALVNKEKDSSEAISSLYKLLIRMRPAYSDNMTEIEKRNADLNMPSYRAEDISTLSTREQCAAVAKAFQIVFGSLSTLRAEVSALLAEVNDPQLASEMQLYESLKARAGGDTATLFRAPTGTETQKTRPKTPEGPLADLPRVDSGLAVNPNIANASDKDSKRSKANSPKTSTAGEFIRGVAAAATGGTASPTPSKGGKKKN